MDYLTKEDVTNKTLLEFVQIVSRGYCDYNVVIENMYNGRNLAYSTTLRIRNGAVIDGKDIFYELGYKYIRPYVEKEDDVTSLTRFRFHVYIDWERGEKIMTTIDEFLTMPTVDVKDIRDCIWPDDDQFLAYKKWNLKPIIPTVVNIGDTVFKCNYNPNPCYDPEKIYARDPYTIIIWRDGTKTKVKCQDGEPYDLEKGIALCYMKKVNGNKPKYYDIFKTGEKKGVIKYGERKGV